MKGGDNMTQGIIYIKVSDLENLLKELKNDNRDIVKLCISESEIPNTRFRLDATAIRGKDETTFIDYDVIEGIDKLWF